MTSPVYDPARWGIHESETERRMRQGLGEEMYWSLEPDWGEFTQDGELVEITKEENQ